MDKIIKSKVKVRFQDCDPFNHLNNSKYLDYFMNAREDQVLECYDLNVYEHFITTKKNWVVANNQIAYIKPAFLMEELIIQSQIFKCTNSTLSVEMKMWDAHEKELKAIYWVKFVYFDSVTKKRTQHSHELMELFSNVENHIDQSIFEERVNYLLISEL
ncbi:acyl-CoA thioesterase [uncultured Croceitalea sp.]|uniref:acyl-CoA thioesterase n=1 Tax=uncultured Croceitalea sp. TaxID=1798908 RepID=UPI0033059A11